MIFRIAAGGRPEGAPMPEGTVSTPTPADNNLAPTGANPQDNTVQPGTSGPTAKDLNQKRLVDIQTKSKYPSAYQTALKKSVQNAIYNQKAADLTKKQLVDAEQAYNQVKAGFYVMQADVEINSPCDVAKATGFTMDQEDMTNIANSYMAIYQQYIGFLSASINQMEELNTVASTEIGRETLGPLISQIPEGEKYIQEDMIAIKVQSLRTEYYSALMKNKTVMMEVSLTQALIPIKTQFVDFFSALCETYLEHDQIVKFMGRSYLPYVEQMRDAYYYGSQMCRQMASIVTRITGPTGKNEARKYIMMAKKMENLGVAIVKDYMDGLNKSTGR